jgi:hypothetical protein
VWECDAFSARGFGFTDHLEGQNHWSKQVDHGEVDEEEAKQERELTVMLTRAKLERHILTRGRSL